MSEQLAVFKEGKGPRVVLIHGLFSTHRYWGQLTRLLRADHEVVSVDLLGFGDSPRPKDNDYTVDDHVEAIYHSLKARKLLSKPYILVGHSMGAQLAVRLAKQHPERVVALVLSAPPAMPKGKERRYILREYPDLLLLQSRPLGRLITRWHERFEKAAMRLAPRLSWRRDFDREILEDAVRHTWESFHRSARRVFIGYNPLSDLVRLDIPIRLISAKRDWLSIDLAKQLRSISLPNLQHLKTATRHNIPLHEPELLATVINSLHS